MSNALQRPPTVQPSLSDLLRYALCCSQFNIANPSTGAMKCIEIDDEKQL